MRLVSTIPEDLCLDYVNTLGWRGSAVPSESLKSPADLLAWIQRRAIPVEGADGVSPQGSGDFEVGADALFAEAIEMREVLFRVFSAVADGTAVPERDFRRLANAVGQAPPRRELARWGDGYAWRIPGRTASVPDLLAPVLWSAADLLLWAGHGRLRRCANDECRWLFIDRSRNGSRRWCDMSSCGNRAKARRHYARTRNT